MTEGKPAVSPLLSGETRLYVIGVSLLGAPILAATFVALFRSPWPSLPQWALAAALGVVAYSILRNLILFEWRGQRVALAPDEVLVFVALIALPIPLAILFAFPAMVAFNYATRREALRQSFNVSVLLVSTAAAVEVFFVARTLLGLPPVASAILGIAAYTPVNLAIVTGVFALREKASVAQVYRERFLVPTLLHFGLGASGGVAIVALWSYHPAALLALAPFLYFARTHVQLVARTDREAVIHRRIAELNQDLVAEPKLEVAVERILETCVDIFHAGRVAITVQDSDGTSHTWMRDAHGGYDPHSIALAELLKGREEVPMGAIVVYPTRDTKQVYGPAERALLRIVAGEAAGSIATTQTLRDLEDSRRALLSTRVARPLVRRILSTLMEQNRADAAVLSQFGHSLAREGKAQDLPTLCLAYGEMGLGTLGVVSAGDPEHVFEGTDLFERSPGSPQTTCHIALGFLCGAVSLTHDGVPARGSEVTCQSRGDEKCKFIVHVRPVVARSPEATAK